MYNKEVIQKRLEDARKQEDVHKAIDILADTQFEIGVQGCRERSLLKKDIELLRRLILGNGNPSGGVMVRLVDLEACVENVSSDVKEIKDKLLGDGKDQGYIDRVRYLEKSHRLLSKIAWLIISITVGELLLTLFGLL